MTVVPILNHAYEGNQPPTLSMPVALLQALGAQLIPLSNYVESNAIHIVNEFKSLSAQSMAHSTHMEQVIGLARNITLQGETIPYERSVEILYEPLADAIEKILQVSKLAMSMVMTISNAAENIANVENCIDQVQQLTKQTNMLALNTQIEAARAGEAGASFRVIAQEVKGLSEHIKILSDQMQQDVGAVSRSVRKSSKLVDDLAHYDMTENLQLKTRIDELIASIMSQNKAFTTMLNDAANMSRKTSESINGLVMGIQFQDRTSQTIADLSQLLNHVIEQLLQGHAISADQMANDVVGNLKLSDVKHQIIAFLESQKMLGSASPLLQWLRMKEHSNSAKFADDVDSVELF